MPRPLALRAVASEVMLMHQCGLDDGHGRLRAQDHVAEAHEGKEAVGTARLGEGGDEAVTLRLKRRYQSARRRAFRAPCGGC